MIFNNICCYFYYLNHYLFSNPKFFEQVKFNTNEFFLNGNNVNPILNVIKAYDLLGYYYNNGISNNLKYRL